MSAVHVLHRLRRGAAPLALCVGLIAAPALAVLDLQHVGESGGLPLVQVQADSANVSPYQEPAPDLFEATGVATWDGKRTLQGVWVAHPLATSARRVRIYNTATGTAVDGALFKRDPALDGPSLLVSSEAAQFLGMPPGEEVNLRIVALTPSQRPERQAVSPPEEQTGHPEPEPTAQAEAPVPIEPTGQPAPAGVPAREPAPTAPREVAGAGAGIPAPRPEPSATTPESGVSESVSTGRPVFRQAPSAEPSATMAAVTIAEPAPELVAPAPDRPAFQAAPDHGSSGTASLAPPAEPAAPQEKIEPEPEPKTLPAAVAPRSRDAARVPPADAPDVRVSAAQPSGGGTALPERNAAASSLSRPYVQAGTFGIAANAERLIGRLQSADLPALGKPAQVNGRSMTRVLAGPFAVEAERDEALRTIRGMGMTDATPVAR